MREKLIELIEQAGIKCGARECRKCEYYGQGVICTTYMLADHLIENGIVTPVRCGECKFAREPYKGGLYCQGKREVSPDHYCNYGEPKESEE